MSESKSQSITTIIVICITVATCFIAACSVGIFIAAPEGANTGSLVTILVGLLGSTIASLAALANTGKIRDNTEKMLNGVMDAKIQRNVHAALDERTASE